MSDKFLETALTEFRASCDDIVLNVRFIETASALRNRLGDFLAWDQIGKEERRFIETFFAAKCDGETSYQGLFVRLIASFEAFVRRMVRDSINIINKSQPTWDLTPERQHLWNRNRWSVGKVLTHIFEPVSFQQINFDELCTDLGTCVPGSVAAKLSAEAIAITVAGSSIELIEEVFNQMGASLNWSQIAANKTVKEFLDQKRTCDAAKETKTWLCNAKDRRNGYAHTGVGGAVVEPNDIRVTATLLLSLAELLARQLEREINITYLAPRKK